MSDPPRAHKRVKTGDVDKAEAEIFKRPEVLTYQNKALASIIKTIKSENEKLKQKNKYLDNTNVKLISCSSLLYEQLLAINDKIVSVANTKNIEFESETNLRTNESIVANQNVFVSGNIDKVAGSDDQIKNTIKEIAPLLISTLSNITNEESTKTSFDVSKLNEELSKATRKALELQNQQVEHEVEVNNLKQKISDLETRTDNDEKYIRVLKLRSDRYFPYIKFESRQFQVEIPKHE